MDQPTKKKQKVDDSTTCKEEVLFNTDTLSKVISYLPSLDLLNLALTCKRFGVSVDDELSIIKKSARLLVHDIATEEQLAALPHYEGESSLADYHYLQLMREPLTFDQLVGTEYVDSEDKSCVTNSGNDWGWKTAFSNNIMRAGKHYASFVVNNSFNNFFVGVMRPGQANESACGQPIQKEFFQNYTQNMRYGECNNDIQCCLYRTIMGNKCFFSNWGDSGSLAFETWDRWEGRESISSNGDEIGILLDLDESTLSVYKNGRKLGVMKRGLLGPYCWVVSLNNGVQVTIKRGTVPSG